MLIIWSIIFGIVAGGVLASILRNSDKFQQILTNSVAANVICLILFVVFNGVGFYLINMDIKNQEFLRDHGIKYFATVTGHHVEHNRRSHTDFIEFSYEFPEGSRHVFRQSQEVHDRTYDNFGIGSRIPIHIDPNNPDNSHTSVSGPRSNDEYTVDTVFHLVEVTLGTTVVVGLFWVLLAAMIGMMREVRADHEKQGPHIGFRKLTETEPVMRFAEAAREPPKAQAQPGTPYRAPLPAEVSPKDSGSPR
jgi:predicted secreted protein